MPVFAAFWSRVLLGALLFAIAYIPSAAAEKRVALIIGNSRYVHTPELKNPKNDAADLAKALRDLNFTVSEGFDLDKGRMDKAIREFAEQLVGADVGLFIYSGHGLQVNGQNYLVPVDAKLTTAAALDFEMIRLDLVQRAMEREAKTNLIILDACRDNPLARNLTRGMGTRSGDVGRGLAAVESGIGTLISFSTQPGNIAFDGDGRNSPFVRALLKHIASPGEDISSILIGVRNDVMVDTNNRQVPWEHSALRAKFFFVQPGSTPTAMTEPGGSDRVTGTFDGVWQVSLQGGNFCYPRTVAFKIRIEENIVFTTPRPGTVKAGGAIEFTTHSREFPDVTVRYTGKLSDGGTGVGTYGTIRGRCTGTMTLKRL